MGVDVDSFNLSGLRSTQLGGGHDTTEWHLASSLYDPSPILCQTPAEPAKPCLPPELLIFLLFEATKEMFHCFQSCYLLWHRHGCVFIQDGHCLN